MQKIVTRLARFGLAFLSLAFAIPLSAYIYMGTFMRLIGDDYCYAATLRRFGFWQAQVQSYVAIGGYNGNRYSLNLLSSLADLVGPKVNAVLPGLALLAWFAGLAWAWRKASRLAGVLTQPLSWLLSAEVLIFFTLSQAPDLDQSLYWRTGMLTYLAPVITGSILIGFVLWQANHLRLHGILLAATFLLALISAGFSEVGAVAHITILASLLIWSGYAAWHRHRMDSPNPGSIARLIAPASSALAGSLVALLLLALSPSTHLRLQALPPSATLLSTLQIALYSARIFIVSVTLKRLLLPHLLLFGIALVAGVLQAEWLVKRSAPQPIMSTGRWLWSLAGIVLISLLTVFLCMLPNAYVQSGYPELRALIIPRFVLVAAIAGIGWLTGRFVHSHLARAPRLIFHLASLLTGLILVAAVAFPLYTTPSILGQAPLFSKWAYLWDQRDQQIRTAASYNLGSVQVMELDHIIPRVGELQVDSWYTQCADQYYGIQILPILPGWDQDVIDTTP